MTNEEFQSILEEAYAQGYKDACDDINLEVFKESLSDNSKEFIRFRHKLNPNSNIRLDVARAANHDLSKKMDEKMPEFKTKGMNRLNSDEVRQLGDARARMANAAKRYAKKSLNENYNEEINTINEDSKFKGHTSHHRQLGYLPASGITGIKRINNKYNHLEKQFKKFHKDLGNDMYEKNPKKIDTDKKKAKYYDLANKLTGTYDAKEKYKKDAIANINFTKYLEKAKKSPNVKARIIANKLYNNYLKKI